MVIIEKNRELNKNNQRQPSGYVNIISNPDSLSALTRLADGFGKREFPTKIGFTPIKSVPPLSF
ncbi:MAG TPA: hypothetical protein DEH07_04640 [Desulfotomaculum sp.]|nr:hypothetical protein [Desulfotomaculum sp.]